MTGIAGVVGLTIVDKNAKYVCAYESNVFVKISLRYIAEGNLPSTSRHLMMLISFIQKFLQESVL